MRLMTVGVIRSVMSLDVQKFVNGSILAGTAAEAMGTKIEKSALRQQAAIARTHGSAAVLSAVMATVAWKVVGSFNKMGDAASDLETSLVKLKTVSRDLTTGDLSDLKKSIMDISKQTGQLTTDISKGAYAAAQAMYTAKEDMKAFALEAGKLSIASGREVDVKEATDGLAAFARQLDHPIEKLHELSDVMLATRNAGLTLQLPDVTRNMARAASLLTSIFPEDKFAAFKDVASLMAAGTYSKMGAPMVATSLRGMVTSMIRESKDADSLLNAVAKSYGYKTGMEMLRGSGSFSNFLDMLYKYGGSDAEYLTELGFKNRQISLATQLMQNPETRKMTTGVIAGAGGLSQEALEKMMKTPEEVTKQLAAAGDRFKKDFGTTVLTYTMPLKRALTDLLDGLRAVPSWIKHTIYLTTVMSALIVSIVALTAVMKFVAATTGIGKLFKDSMYASLIGGGLSKWRGGMSAIDRATLANRGLTHRDIVYKKGNKFASGTDPDARPVGYHKRVAGGRFGAVIPMGNFTKWYARLATVFKTLLMWAAKALIIWSLVTGLFLSVRTSIAMFLEDMKVSGINLKAVFSWIGDVFKGIGTFFNDIDYAALVKSFMYAGATVFDAIAAAGQALVEAIEWTASKIWGVARGTFGAIKEAAIYATGGHEGQTKYDAKTNSMYYVPPKYESLWDAIKGGFTGGFAKGDVLAGMNPFTDALDNFMEKQVRYQKWTMPPLTTEAAPKALEAAAIKPFKFDMPVADDLGEEFKEVTKVVREFASALLYGSTESWNARLPSYQTTEKELLDTSRKTLKEAEKQNTYLKTISENFTSGGEAAEFVGAEI